MDRADKMELLHAALRNDNATEFARLLKRFPDCRYDGAGDDYWMSAVAMRGKLWAIELLVARGADVNRPSNSTDSVPSPEGPIVYAANNGHMDVVRYMLDRGAEINHMIEGRVRCQALVGAAIWGHLDVVKLLVERGAAVNAVWAEMTPLDQSELHGRDEVAAYLRSIGWKTAAELGESAS
ncbi:Ankyrin repeats (3 copies) [Gemmata sp. SH-PL17]|uniref:ankyrin repeat domain-containing protein n=1 Tax=Gemmata sp. SH-PL17 TaxID=1630693 RepID=UPI0004BA5414|nr:ankyrin repeat domain-containing protein [Gemmata sp. SH-PL17]AMV28569.1 Ankyrin repeats (3 copies) [Gemmata sp. SH-PL17]